MGGSTVVSVDQALPSKVAASYGDTVAHMDTAAQAMAEGAAGVDTSLGAAVQVVSGRDALDDRDGQAVRDHVVHLTGNPGPLDRHGFRSRPGLLGFRLT